MKKRNIILATAATAIVGSGIAFAGSKSCGYGGHEGRGHFSEHKIEHMVDRLDHHLDLTDQQEESLLSIMESNKSVFEDMHRTRKSFRQEILKLDPTASNYDETVSSLADDLAEQVRNKTIQAADIVKQASSVLSEEQVQKVRDLMQEKMHKHG